jgi:hypothetical protein
MKKESISLLRFYAIQPMLILKYHMDKLNASRNTSKSLINKKKTLNV